MTRRPPPALRAAAALLLLPVLLAAATLSPAEERGKRIYRQGSGSGEITAVLGEGTVEVPASAVACAGCHGTDGRGRPEGGVAPTDLTWDRLTRPYGAEGAGGRRHPPYDERTLVRAIALGLDPAGNRLHAAMPRFRMGREDMADLVAYLQRLGGEGETGVSADAVFLGVVLPAEKALTPMAEAVRRALEARFATANQAGGLFGRRLELRAVAAEGTPAERRAMAARFLEREAPFALVAPYLAGAERELGALLDERGVPAIGPLTLFAPSSGAGPVFHLLPGVEAQARALVRAEAAMPAPGPRRPAVVAPDDELLAAAVAEVARACGEAGWEASVQRYPAAGWDADGLVHRLAAAGAGPVFFLGTAEQARRLLAAAARARFLPRVFATARASDPSLLAAPAAFDGRLFVALPTLPRDRTAAAAERHERLAAVHGLPREHLSAQLAALAAAEVLIEGLTRAGRDLTRDGLIAALEGLRGFETGYAPPLTFGPNRRLGARGAYLARADLRGGRFVPMGDWIAAD